MAQGAEDVPRANRNIVNISIEKISLSIMKKRINAISKYFFLAYLGIRAENLARKTLSRGFPCIQTAITYHAW